MAAKEPKVIVVGGGLAGLAACVRMAEAGIKVDLMSVVPVKRSHSVCAQGGINACNDVARQQGYSEWTHMDETLYGGDFINHQPPVYEMTHWAPRIIDLLDRMGVPFNRTPEGFRDLRLFGGSLFKRTHFAGATTGQQLLYALDEQTRRYTAAGLIKQYEFWEFLAPVLDDNGVCRGCVAQDMKSMEMKTFKADAVVLATGGCGVIYGKSTNSVVCNGAAAVRAYTAGAKLGNPEFIQVHPTAIPGEDKCRLMSESARGEGGRVWVPAKKNGAGAWEPHPNAGLPPHEIPDSERYYFLEEKYPAYGNLVPRDIATREIFWKCQEGFGIGGGRMVYLDCTHLPDATKKKLDGIFEIYEKFTGDDPREVAMKIFPAMHYTMGGVYTTYTSEERPAVLGDPAGSVIGMKLGAPNNMMTDIQGLYAFGEVNYQYHGGTRLGANALLSCIFDGLFCGPSVVNYAQENMIDAPDNIFEAELKKEEAKVKKLIDRKGPENPYKIHLEMADIMVDQCTVVKNETGLEKAISKIEELKDRYERSQLSDTGTWTNQNLGFTRGLWDMLRYAEAIARASYERKESRGSHYRDDYTTRIDDPYLASTVVSYDAANDKPIIEYEKVTMGLVEPRARTYGSVEKTEDKKEEKAEQPTA